MGPQVFQYPPVLTLVKAPPFLICSENTFLTSFSNNFIGSFSPSFKADLSLSKLASNLFIKPLFQFLNGKASIFLVSEPAEVAPIVICVAKSGVILVLKSKDLTKLDSPSGE